MPGISFLVDGSPLAVLATVMRGLAADVRKEIGNRTRGPADDIWREELNQHVETRLQGAVARSGRVSVTQRNVTMKAGTAGTLSSGTPVRDITYGAEFGMREGRPIETKSRKGKRYTRRMGPVFGPRRRQGNTVYPASRGAISRLASLWVQTAYRTIHEKIGNL